MNTFTIILGYSFTVGLAEAIIFLVAAVLLGFSIHFFWAGRRSVPGIRQLPPLDPDAISEDDQWRLQFYEQIEKHEKTQERLEKELLRMTEAEKLLLAELDEARDEVTRLEQLAEKNAINAPEVSNSSKNISELLIAQQNLNDYLSKEMTERLEKAYQEFNFLQERMHRIQSQVVDPRTRNIEHEELLQSFTRVQRDYEELKLKHLTLLEEHQRLTRTVADAEEILRESNFQKNQLSKKVVFLEELVKDLQDISGHHKKLETQLRRIGEIESLLSRTASEEKKL